MPIRSFTSGDTFKEVFTAWVSDAVFDVNDRARALVSGPLIKARSGKLRESIFMRFPSPSDPQTVGEVGTGLDYAVIWELTGVTGPFGAKGGGNLKLRLPFEGSLRGFQFAGKGKGKGKAGSNFHSNIIFRKKSYTKTQFKPPVQFLKKALMTEMTGIRGNTRLAVLGMDTGLAVLRRFRRMWEGKQGENVTVTFSGS